MTTRDVIGRCVPGFFCGFPDTTCRGQMMSDRDVSCRRTLATSATALSDKMIRWSECLAAGLLDA